MFQQDPVDPNNSSNELLQVGFFLVQDSVLSLSTDSTGRLASASADGSCRLWVPQRCGKKGGLFFFLGGEFV